MYNAQIMSQYSAKAIIKEHYKSNLDIFIKDNKNMLEQIRNKFMTLLHNDHDSELIFIGTFELNEYINDEQYYKLMMGHLGYHVEIKHWNDRSWGNHDRGINMSVYYKP